MAFTDTPKIGVNLGAIIKAADVPTKGHKLGSQVWGTDGKRYVYAQASEAITASTAVASINSATFAATATAGTYLSPDVDMASGDQGWFAAASV